MTNNKPKAQVAIDFLAKLHKEVYKYLQYIEKGNPDQYDQEKSYADIASLVVDLAQDNYQEGKNIVLYSGNGYMVNHHHNHNPFKNCKLALLDSSYVPYICVGIQYRDIPGKSVQVAKEEAIAIAKTVALRPTAIVDTGVSIQLYWNFSDGYYNFFFPYGKGEDERFFMNDRNFCAQVDAFWLIINHYAQQAGLMLEPSAIDIFWKNFDYETEDSRFRQDDICSIDTYSLIPGFVHYFYNKETHAYETFMVEVLEHNDYMYDDATINDWIDTWVDTHLIMDTIRGAHEHTIRRDYIDSFLRGKVFYHTLIKLYPKSWMISYTRRGIVQSFFEKEALEWVRQTEANDLAGKEDFYFLYSKEEQASMGMAEPDNWE